MAMVLFKNLFGIFPYMIYFNSTLKVFHCPKVVLELPMVLKAIVLMRKKGVQSRYVGWLDMR